MKALRPVSQTLVRLSKLQSTSSRRAAFITTVSSRANSHNRSQKRSFVQNPFTQNQTLTAQRTLAYPSSVIYEIISDVASYSHFVPYCQKSTITKTSAPASDGKTYPEEATLTIGFNDNISEDFTSRIYCVPGRIIEAVSGYTQTTLPPADIPHHSARTEGDLAQKNTVLTHLLTRWTLRPYPYKPPPTSATIPGNTHKNHEETSPLPGQEKTEVNLAIEYQFSNPLYAALSQAAAPRIAEKMIEAFENRVKAVLEGPGWAKSGKQRMEGVVGKKM